MFASTSTVLGNIIPLFFGLIWLRLTFGGFAVWVYLIVTTYRDKTTRLPVVAGIADKLV